MVATHGGAIHRLNRHAHRPEAGGALQSGGRELLVHPDALRCPLSHVEPQSTLPMRFRTRTKLFLGAWMVLITWAAPQRSAAQAKDATAHMEKLADGVYAI